MVPVAEFCTAGTGDGGCTGALGVIAAFGSISRVLVLDVEIVGTGASMGE